MDQEGRPGNEKKAMELLANCYENGWLGLNASPKMAKEWRAKAKQLPE